MDMRVRMIVFCLLATTGCQAKSPATPTPLDIQLMLAPGQAAQVATGVRVRFLTVTGDSRCPADALCIWGGDAVVRIEITAGQSAAERELHTANRQPADHENVRVELVQLDPYPFSARPIALADYRATLRVTR